MSRLSRALSRVLLSTLATATEQEANGECHGAGERPEATAAVTPPAESEPRVAAVQLPAPPAARLEDFDVVLYDLETTGLSSKNDSIVEIAAQRMRYANGQWRREGPHLETLVKPGRAIPAGATAVHGIGDADVANAPTVAAALEQFQAYIAAGPRCVLMAHNGVRFDRHFVKSAWQAELAHAEQSGRFSPVNMEYIGDTEQLFRLLTAGSHAKYSLGALYEECEGPPTVAHRALADVRMIEHVLSRLWRAGDVVTSLAALTKTGAELARDLGVRVKVRNRALVPVEEWGA